jgi:hypothetical protein
MSRVASLTNDIDVARSRIDTGARLLLVMVQHGGCQGPTDPAPDLQQVMAFIADAMLGHLETIAASVDALEAMEPQA